MKLLILSLSLLVANSAYAEKISIENIKCSASKGGTDRLEITPALTKGISPEKKIDYKDAKLSVGFSAGNQYEGQQILVLEIDGYTSQIYGPKPSLYSLESPSYVRIQCHIEGNECEALSKLERLSGVQEQKLEICKKDSECQALAELEIVNGVQAQKLAMCVEEGFVDSDSFSSGTEVDY